MKLNDLSWEEFYLYLTVDAKIKDNKLNVSGYLSIFRILKDYFSSVELNRRNFNVFIAEKKSIHKPNYLNRFIKIAKHLDRYLKINELQDYSGFKEVEKEIEVLTPEEVKKLSLCNYPYKRLKEERQFRDYVAIVFLYSTAARMGELDTLLWEDVKSSPIPHVIFRDTKNGEDAIVPISQNLYNLIQKLPHTRNNVMGDLDRNNFSVVIKKRAELCGINKNVYPHIFRHSRITHLTMLYKFPLAEVSKFARHADPKTTMRYTHPLLSELSPIAYATPFEDTKNSLTELMGIAKEQIKRIFPKNEVFLKKIGEEFHIVVGELTTGEM